MRSSALGEDTRDASFAGQYRSVLNVSRENLILSYKEIIASKYSVPAISYRLNKGFRDEDIIMSVGCMSMVDAASGGVIYSADPSNIRHQYIIINAVLGLGKSVVDGSMAPDLFILSKKDPKNILENKISAKNKQLVSDISEGIHLEDVAPEKSKNAAITDKQAARLGKLALQLEKHFGYPQDIEWALNPDGSVLILQSRPLMVLGEEMSKIQDLPETTTDFPAIALENGVTASPGVASGPAFVVKTTVDMLQFPAEAVLVTKNPLPQWAALLNSAVAVITDKGGVTGHMAAVAREFKVPALVGTSNATELIHNGDIVTVDATGRAVYKGRIESLLEKASEKTSLMKGSPVHNTLGNVLKHIAPLNLTDPDAPNFNPRSCRTIHDIIRFAHEMSLPELFGFKKNGSFPEHLAKRLVIDVPMQWWIIDLCDGCKEGIEGDTIRLEDITSEPMLTLWEGITAVPWQGPPPIDTKGFFSVMYGATLDKNLVPGMRSRYNDRNYLMISNNFCHLSSRFGFHFSTVEAFWGRKVTENYICFNFNGGAADDARRARRANLIKLILEKFDLWVKMKGDTVFARIERREVPFLKERLKVLGHLVMHTRQLDMVLSNSGRVNQYLEKILKELSSFVNISE
jgi:pyruvate,water dikinase